MAFSFLSRFRIKPDCEKRFVELALKMQEQAPKEPGTLHFQFFRLADEGMFAVYESFVDEAADKAHMEYEQNKPLIAEMVDCMAGGYEREMLYDMVPAK